MFLRDSCAVILLTAALSACSAFEEESNGGSVVVEYAGLSYNYVTDELIGLQVTELANMPVAGDFLYTGRFEGSLAGGGFQSGDAELRVDFGFGNAVLELDGSGRAAGRVEGNEIIDVEGSGGAVFQLEGKFYGDNAEAAAGTFRVGVNGGGALSGGYLVER